VLQGGYARVTKVLQDVYKSSCRETILDLLLRKASQN
jgi:hypothetical protein